MPIGTAFHERTFALCESLNYREWSGYYAVSSYEPHHEHEYNAIRNAAALIDISPLYKYRLTGRDATRLVDRIITRDMRKVSVGQVVYTPWCDEHGKVIDDGTVSRLEENTYRWTAADPSLRWFTQNATGMDVDIEDISESVSALALQGPTSGRLLKRQRRYTFGNIFNLDVHPGCVLCKPAQARIGCGPAIGVFLEPGHRAVVDHFSMLIAPRRVDDLAHRHLSHVTSDYAIDQSRRISTRQPVLVEWRDIDQRRSVANRVVFMFVMWFVRADGVIAGPFAIVETFAKWKCAFVKCSSDWHSMTLGDCQGERL